MRPFSIQDKNNSEQQCLKPQRLMLISTKIESIEQKEVVIEAARQQRAVQLAVWVRQFQKRRSAPEKNRRR